MNSTRGILYFDASCGICAAGATRLERMLLRRGFALEPLQSVAARQLLGLKPGEIPDEIKLQTRQGEILGEAAAMLYIARQIWWAWPAWLLSKLPGAKQLFEAMYRMIARRRYGLGAACRMNPNSHKSSRHRTFALVLTILVACVWLYHGLYSKLMHGHPRHLLIVQSIPVFAGAAGQRVLTFVAIGEIVLALWVLIGIAPRAAAIVQTLALLGMNVMELTWARQHLIWPAGLIPINLLFLAAAWIAAELRRSNPISYALRRHPIPIDAHFRHCLVLTYSIPEDVLGLLLPPGLQVDSYHGKGFLAVAIVRTESLRPARLPRQLGRSFVLTGYRIFTKFHDGRHTLRGLRILRSDANKSMMVWGGNLLTHYNYQLCRASLSLQGSSLRVRITTLHGTADLELDADLSGECDAPLPGDSPFTSVQDARRFAGPLPWTFDYERETHSIIAIKGVRREWRPRIVPVQVKQCNFLSLPAFAGATPVLASAFYVSDIAYRWERGVRHPLDGASQWPP